jgi:opacity protein-like surface antigen
MRKMFLTAAAVAALAVPAVASAGVNPGGATGVSTNAPDSAAIGFCVSAGNYNYLNGGQGGFTSTGQDRSSYAGTPGGVADLIAGARDACASWMTPYAPPGQ